MQIFPRAADQGSGKLQGLLGALSLAVATYKPTPILPTSRNISNVQLPESSGGSSFQVAGDADGAGSKVLAVPHQQLNQSEWGTPSTLWVPNNWAGSTNNSGNSLAQTVGSGGCRVLSEYTPNSALPKAYDFEPFDQTAANIMRYRKQIAVNLGSWFVLENWMAPSMFSCANHAASAEHDVLTGYGVSKTGLSSARARLEQHWDTWVTKKDFARMKAMGLNTVRLPIGYWSVGELKWLENTPFNAWESVYKNSPKYITRAIQWAAEYDLGVLLDLHGAYGSQNGQAHSGVSDGNIGFFDKTNEDRTTDLLVYLTEKFANVTNVIGIEVLNEPNGWYRTQLYDWLPGAISAMRKANNPQAKTLPIFFHDGFSLSQGASFVQSRSDFVVQDNHMYYVYSDSDKGTTAAGHTSRIEGSVASSLQSSGAKARNNLIVGEWSCALASSSLSGARNAHSSQQTFCNAQASVYMTNAGGWGFWSWRLESCEQNAGWCFQATVNTRLLTSPLAAWTNNGGNNTGSSSSSSKGSSFLQGKNSTQVLQQVAKGAQDMPDPALPYSAGSKRQWRGGSPAARAAAAVRSTLSAAELAGNSGYSDGYLTAKIFASRTDVSRMGFSGQYASDSFAAHTEQGTLQKDAWALYAENFDKGLAAAEGKISALVQQYA